ncbi:MAG: aspartate aminotransferase family protein [Aigarchaeota archaeon]|nr:aspartate aminotransferase family protein [Aigarchaeota archaeon]
MFDLEMDSTLKFVRFYAPRDLKLVRGEGQYLWDIYGKRYLDCHTAHGVAFLGHRNPWVVQELKKQLDELITASPIFATQAMEEAVKLLEKALPKNLAYFYLLNSGSEGIELALKAARKVTKRRRFISFINAFHGRTMGALAVTWNPRYRKDYDPFPWEVEFLPYNDPGAVEKKVDENVAAVIVEPVQGEGGLAAASPEFLRAVRDSCDRHGALMIVDEIQSGFGRTGILWAHQRADIKSDIMVAGKSLGGGFPISVTAFSEEVGSKLEAGDHGSTFGGNPLALAALKGGIRALLEDNVVEKAAEAGKLLTKTLEEVVSEHESAARGARGIGLMAGIELRTNPMKAVQELQGRGVLALRAGLTVLRLLPPYLITRRDIEFLRGALDGVLAAMKPEPA